MAAVKIDVRAYLVIVKSESLPEANNALRGTSLKSSVDRFQVNP